MIDGFFRYCPSCISDKISLIQPSDTAGRIEFCVSCNFAVNHVLFTCGCCNPDVFALCPRRECAARGVPTKNLCAAF